MTFWTEMQTKWGFGDGDATPCGVEVYRRAYILAVNTLAERLNSAVRAVAFNRGGVHNFCLVYMAPAEAAKPYSAEVLASGEAPDLWEGDDLDQDEPMQEAVRLAYEIGIDSYVRSKVTLPKNNLAALLKTAQTLPLEAPNA